MLSMTQQVGIPIFLILQNDTKDYTHGMAQLWNQCLIKGCLVEDPV